MYVYVRSFSDKAESNRPKKKHWSALKSLPPVSPIGSGCKSSIFHPRGKFYPYIILYFSAYCIPAWKVVDQKFRNSEILKFWNEFPATWYNLLFPLTNSARPRDGGGVWGQVDSYTYLYISTIVLFWWYSTKERDPAFGSILGLGRALRRFYSNNQPKVLIRTGFVHLEEGGWASFPQPTHPPTHPQRVGSREEYTLVTGSRSIDREPQSCACALRGPHPSDLGSPHPEQRVWAPTCKRIILSAPRPNLNPLIQGFIHFDSMHNLLSWFCTSYRDTFPLVQIVRGYNSATRNPTNTQKQHPVKDRMAVRKHSTSNWKLKREFSRNIQVTPLKELNVYMCIYTFLRGIKIGQSSRSIQFDTHYISSFSLAECCEPTFLCFFVFMQTEKWYDEKSF